MFQRYCELSDVLSLPSPRTTPLPVYFHQLKTRLVAKAAYLRELVPGLTGAASRDAIAICSVQSNWRRVEQLCDGIDGREVLEALGWEAIGILPASYEPRHDEFPLAPVPMVGVRAFAKRLEAGMHIEAPCAHRLTATLFGAPDWEAVSGPRRFIPLSEPLYTYRQSAGEVHFAHLVPCAGLERVEEEIEASQAYHWSASLSTLIIGDVNDRPASIASGVLVLGAHVCKGKYTLVNTDSDFFLPALDAIYPSDCRLPLAPCSTTHARYIKFRAARYVGFLLSGESDKAEVEREILNARGRFYTEQYRAVVALLPQLDRRLLERHALSLVPEPSRFDLR
ncbi:hypothetical protein SBC2_84460 (plasmid) [Caballeronia sp. SBC2]|nr:hypothetical protein SBC2_84460 [Caballeronia sp. SBC2]